MWLVNVLLWAVGLLYLGVVGLLVRELLYREPQ